MSLIPYRSLWDPEDFFEDWNFPRSLKTIAIQEPKMDIYEEEDNIIAEIEAPGINPEKIEITIKDNVLRVEGGEEKKVEEKKKGYYRKEINKGYFKRITTLPVEVIGDKADAVYTDGLLKIVIPKAKPVKKEEAVKKIKVKTIKK